MSDRLAISAALSILLMSIYVLFGSDAVRRPLSAGADIASVRLPLPEVSLDVIRR